MIPTMCMIQEGQVPDSQRLHLATGIEKFCQDSFGEKAELTWVEVPRGAGFTGGVPSTSILCSMRANTKLAQSDRVNLLKELCALWMDETGKSTEEVVVSISDPA